MSFRSTSTDMTHVLLKPLTFSSLAFAHERTCEDFSLYFSRCQPKTTERQTCTPNKHCLPAKLIIIPFFLKESKLRACIVKSFSAFTEKHYHGTRRYEHKNSAFLLPIQSARPRRRVPKGEFKNNIGHHITLFSAP